MTVKVTQFSRFVQNLLTLKCAGLLPVDQYIIVLIKVLYFINHNFTNTNNSLKFEII